MSNTAQSSPLMKRGNADISLTREYIDAVLREAQIYIESGLLPKDISTPGKAFLIIQQGAQLRIPSLMALNGIHVIQGKPSVSPQLMLSLINRSGLLQDIAYEDDGSTGSVTMKRAGIATPHTGTFSNEDAKKMGLSGRAQWQNQPATMRRWRAVAAAARFLFPDIIGGLYLNEEMGAMTNEDGEVIRNSKDEIVMENGVVNKQTNVTENEIKNKSMMVEKIKLMWQKEAGMGKDLPDNESTLTDADMLAMPSEKIKEMGVSIKKRIEGYGA